ncbi:MAG: hypothetical protein GVY19_12070 [Bacteroidetes bacterium]|nr:hypothetical protein [Bacteroidota bacterium]
MKETKNLVIMGMMLLAGIQIYAQDDSYDRALQLFNEGDYKRATPYFQNLIQHYEKEPAYHYYLGRCYVHQNTEIKKAIALLSFAGAKGKFSDTYYYLGLAYMYNYQFKEAQTAFEKFPLFASRQDLRDINIDQYVSYTKNGKVHTSKPVNVNKVLNQHTNADINERLNAFITNGTFLPVPDDYQSFLWGDDKLIKPAFRTNGKLYYAAYNIRTRSHDIFEADESNRQSRLLSNTLVSDAEESFAWFDTQSNTLYFSSNGFNSMGGFDIFKSQYNPSANTWSVPVNLGFPINSPHDEVGFVHLPSSEKAMLITNRTTNSDEYVAFELSTSLNHLMSPGNYSIATMQTLASFNVNAAKSDKNKQSGAGTTKKNPITRQNTLNDELLYTALNYQLKADSFLRESEKKRARLKTIIPEQEKNSLYKQIEADEAQWKKYQRLADMNYNELHKSDDSHQSSSTSTSREKEIVTMRINPFHKSKNAPASEFRINNSDTYNDLSQIAVDPPLPDHLMYKIQLGVFSKPVEPSKFGGLSPITAEYLEQKKLTKYYCGRFVSYNDAYDALKKIKTHGFSDAYIISYYQGRKIPVSRARELEKSM